MNRTEHLLQHMTYLYLKFCLPRVTQDAETGKVEVTYNWVNEDARQEFEKIREAITSQYEQMAGGDPNHFEAEIRKLAGYLQEHWKEEIKEEETAAELAIRLLRENRPDKRR